MNEHKATRRQFLKSIGATAAGIALSGCSPESFQSVSKQGKKRRPNILFICTDYQSGKDGPSLGSPFLDMPALDRLCKEGVVFTRHYSTAPICMPARYTWVTGTYPHTHGQQDNWARWVPDHLPILMQCLSDAGYYTLGIGKMHFHPWDKMAGYHRRIIADRKGNWKGDNKRNDDYAKFLAEHNLTRWDYLKFQTQGDMGIFGVYDWPYDESLHIDAYVGDQVKRVIENNELKKPWFLWVSFNGPHDPWDPPAKYSEKYKKMDLPVGHTFEGELKTKPTDHTRLRYNYTKAVVDRIDEDPDHRKEIVQRIRAGHYGGLTFIDHQIEGILKALEEKGKLDDTIIIYSADHGCHLGDHNLIHKGTCYESSAHVPFVVRCPGFAKPRSIESFSSHVDFMPTILSIAGATIPDTCEGKDLTPMIVGEADSVQEHVVLEIRGSTSIITDRWKMGIYPGDGDGDLYDLRADPDELNNLYDRPEYAEIQRKLLEKMKQTNPNLAVALAKPPRKSIPDKDEFQLKSGDILPPLAAPYPPGRAITITAKLTPISEEQKLNGVIVAQMGWTNGYTLYVKDGKLAMALKRWQKYTIVSAEDDLPSQPVNITADLAKDGTITLIADGKNIASGKADGPWPDRPGKKTNFTTAKLEIGKVKDEILIDDHKLTGEFHGKIEDIKIKLS